MDAGLSDMYQDSSNAGEDSDSDEEDDGYSNEEYAFHILTPLLSRLGDQGRALKSRKTKSELSIDSNSCLMAV